MPIVTSDISYICHCIVVVWHGVAAAINRLKLLPLMHAQGQDVQRLTKLFCANAITMIFMAAAAGADYFIASQTLHETFAGTEFINFFMDTVWWFSATWQLK